MTNVLVLPTSFDAIPEFAAALAQAEAVTLELPPGGSNRRPEPAIVSIVANLLQEATQLERITLSPAKTPSRSELVPPRSLSRGGLWLALHNSPAEVVVEESEGHVSRLLRTWDPMTEPPGQGHLLASELQWRPTAPQDVSSRRVEYRVGFMDRPEQRLAAHDSPDEFAAAIASEVAAVAAGASRDALPDGSAEFARLMGRAISTWVENIDEHASDYDAIPQAPRRRALVRRRRSSLLVSMSRGGGSAETEARSSHNRVSLTVRDNGVSIPSTVRGRKRLGGTSKSEAIVQHLLSSLTGEARSDLKGLGYPDLMKLAGSSLKLGWKSRFELMTQSDDDPKSLVLGSSKFLDGEDGPIPDVNVRVVEDTPFVGTSATITILVPGRPDWLGGIDRD
jgi:hypothetical protein